MSAVLPSVVISSARTVKPEILRFWRRIEGIGLDDVEEPEPLARYLRRNPGLSMTLRAADGTLVGVALCGHDGRRGYLHHVSVDLAWRDRGLGRRLVDACLERLAAEGIVRCHMLVFANNDAGLAFHEKTGWRLRNELRIFSRDLDRP